MCGVNTDPKDPPSEVSGTLPALPPREDTGATAPESPEMLRATLPPPSAMVEPPHATPPEQLTAELPAGPESVQQGGAIPGPLPVAPSDADQPVPSQSAPEWVASHSAPQRARRRVNAQRFWGWSLPWWGALALVPAAVMATLENDLPPMPAATVAGEPAPSLAPLDNALDALGAQVEQGQGPAAQMARTECKRAAYRGAALVDQELRHVAGATDVATRNAVENLARRVGLTTPLDGTEGEVLLNADGSAVAGVVPHLFAPLLEGVKDGTAEQNGRVLWKVRVGQSSYWVAAMRALPPAVDGAALAAVKQQADALRGWLEKQQQTPRGDEGWAAWGAAVQSSVEPRVGLLGLVGALCAAVWLVLVRRHVTVPLQTLRTDLDRVRAGQRPMEPATPDGLAEWRRVLGDISERLHDVQVAALRGAERQKALEDLVEVCRRAERGDLTARPSSTPGPEALVGLALTHLLESMEQQVARIRVQARTVLESIGVAGQMTAPTADAPAIKEPLETLRQRLDSLGPLPNLIRNLSTRLGGLTQQRELAVVTEDLKKLAAALAPRAQAAAALLKDADDQRKRLADALTASQGTGAQDALDRARKAAGDLCDDARAWRADGSIPTVLASVRDLPAHELQRAWRDGSELPPH
jgi:hypothetical protein